MFCDVETTRPLLCLLALLLSCISRSVVCRKFRHVAGCISKSSSSHAELISAGDRSPVAISRLDATLGSCGLLGPSRIQGKPLGDFASSISARAPVVHVVLTARLCGISPTQSLVYFPFQRIEIVYKADESPGLGPLAPHLTPRLGSRFWQRARASSTCTPSHLSLLRS